MSKKITLLLSIFTLLVLVGCQVPQENSDVSFVPIDQIKVDTAISSDSDAMEDGAMEADTMEDDGMMDEEHAMEDDAMDAMESDDDMSGESDEEMSTEPEAEEESIEELAEDPSTDEESSEETEESVEETTEEEEPTEEVDESVEEISTEEDVMIEEETTPNSEIVIIVEETEMVSLQPVASDPDDDVLTFTYSLPLDDVGKWQTTYGDAGEYTVTITVSDSELTSSKDALLIVNKKEELPTLDSLAPVSDTQEIAENTQLAFSVDASDLNNDPLTYTWKLDGEIVSTDETFTLEADYDSAGSHTVKLDVFDGTNTVSNLWSVTINNVDRAPVLKVIKDITVKETETVVIVPDATDPDADEITYTISNPIGDSGVWETTYDDAGVYTINVVATGSELSDTQEVKVTVINVNRPPVIDDIIKVG